MLLDISAGNTKAATDAWDAVADGACQPQHSQRKVLSQLHIIGPTMHEVLNGPLDSILEFLFARQSHAGWAAVSLIAGGSVDTKGGVHVASFRNCMILKDTQS